jgi:hypothetical protein
MTGALRGSANGERGFHSSGVLSGVSLYLVADVSGKPMFKGQELLDPWRRDRYVVPKRRYNVSTNAALTSLKSKQINCNAAEATPGKTCSGKLADLHKGPTEILVYQDLSLSWRWWVILWHSGFRYPGVLQWIGGTYCLHLHRLSLQNVNTLPDCTVSQSSVPQNKNEANFKRKHGWLHCQFVARTR